MCKLIDIIFFICKINFILRFDNWYFLLIFKKNVFFMDIFYFMIFVKVLRILIFGMISKIKLKKYLVFLCIFSCYFGGYKLFVSW